MSNFLRPRGLRHTRPPLSLTSSQSFPKFMSYRWCHPTISFSVVPFSSLPLIFPSIRVFSNELALPISGQSIGALASASVLPVTIPGCFLLGLPGLIFWLKNLLQHHNSKPSILWHLAFFMIQLSHPYMTAGKTTALTIWTLPNLKLKRLSPDFCHVDQY